MRLTCVPSSAAIEGQCSSDGSSGHDAVPDTRLVTRYGQAPLSNKEPSPNVPGATIRGSAETSDNAERSAVKVRCHAAW